MSRNAKKTTRSVSKPQDIDVQREQWRRYLETLPPEESAIVQQETDAAKVACGSRLTVAKHLSRVHDILCRDLKNAKQKKQWTVYLRVSLPGLAISRSQVFKDIKAWERARTMFPASFLDSFLSSGYALAVRPSVDAPLGKYTEPCQHVLSHLGEVNPTKEQVEQVLTDVVQMLKREAKNSHVPPAKKTAEEKRLKALSDVHEAVISQLLNLIEAVEPNEKYTKMHLRDDLELIIGRLMAATEMDALDIEPRDFPDDFSTLTVPDPERNARLQGVGSINAPSSAGATA